MTIMGYAIARRLAQALADERRTPAALREVDVLTPLVADYAARESAARDLVVEMKGGKRWDW